MQVVRSLLQAVMKWLAPSECETKRSGQWPALRKRHLEAFPSCAACGGEEELEAHHVVPVSVDASKELDPSNLITLCEKRGCHLTFGHLYSYRSWNKTVRPDCLLWRSKVRNRP